MSQSLGSSGLGTLAMSKYKRRDNYSNQLLQSKNQSTIQGISPLRKNNASMEISHAPPLINISKRQVDRNKETQTEDPRRESRETNTLELLSS